MDEDVLAALLGSPTTADRYRRAGEDERIALAEEGFDLPLGGVARTVVLNQIADGSEPHATVTAQRLLDAGLAPERVVAQMSLAALQQIQSVMVDEVGFDRETYKRALAELPLPEPAAIRRVLLDVAADVRVLDRTALLAGAADGLGVDGELAAIVVERCADDLTVEFGPLLMLEGDRITSLQALGKGRVLPRPGVPRASSGVIDGLGSLMAPPGWVGCGSQG